MSNKIKPLTLEIDEEVWTKFKEVTPRTKTLNDAVVGLIYVHLDLLIDEKKRKKK